MKKLILYLVLPLTVILFFTITKWTCVQIDGPNIVLQGFPLPYVSPGLGSSMTWDFFVAEFVFDVLVYFLLVLVICYLVDRFIYPIKPNNVISITLCIIAILFLCLQVLLYSIETTFYLHRNFDIKVINSSFTFFWQQHPDCF